MAMMPIIYFFNDSDPLKGLSSLFNDSDPLNHQWLDIASRSARRQQHAHSCLRFGRAPGLCCRGGLAARPPMRDILRQEKRQFRSSLEDPPSRGAMCRLRPALVAAAAATFLGTMPAALHAQFPAEVRPGARVRVWLPEPYRQEEGPARRQLLRGMVETVTGYTPPVDPRYCRLGRDPASGRQAAAAESGRTVATGNRDRARDRGRPRRRDLLRGDERSSAQWRSALSYRLASGRRWRVVGCGDRRGPGIHLPARAVAGSAATPLGRAAPHVST